MFKIIKKTLTVLLNYIVNGSNHTKCVLLSNQKYITQLILLIYILINTVKYFTSINFRLNLMDMLEVVILLMTYLIKYVLQIKEKILFKNVKHDYRNKLIKNINKAYIMRI